MGGLLDLGVLRDQEEPRVAGEQRESEEPRVGEGLLGHGALLGLVQQALGGPRVLGVLPGPEGLLGLG